MGAAKVSTDPVGDLVGAEQPGRLDDGALAMHPLGFDRIEPRTLDGQKAGQDAHALALLLDLAVVGADPGPHALAHVPGGVVPDEHPHAHAGRSQAGAAKRVQHQSKNGSVMALTGCPSTKRSQTRSGWSTWRSNTP